MPDIYFGSWFNSRKQRELDEVADYNEIENSIKREKKKPVVYEDRVEGVFDVRNEKEEVL